MNDASSHSSTDKDAISLVSFLAIFLEKNIGDVCAKTRRYPLTRTTEKFRKFGDVYNAEFLLNKLPNPTIETKLSLVMVFAGGWRDVIDGKVLCVIELESEGKFENFSTFIKRIVIETMTPSSPPSQEYALQPALTIFCAAFFLQLLLECINYLVVRRKKEFKLNRVKLETTLMEIEKVQRERKLLEENASYSSEEKNSKKKQLEKKKKSLDLDLATHTRKVNAMKMKLAPMTAMANILFLRTLSAKFKGVVVSTLPFNPPGMVKNLVHRGVDGDDFTQMGCTGFYSLSAMIARAIVQKFFELKPPRAVAQEAWEKSQRRTEAIVNMFEKDSKTSENGGSAGEKKKNKNKVKTIGGSKKRR
jgi:uncharacterized membrane protein (DUF106 family)